MVIDDGNDHYRVGVDELEGRYNSTVVSRLIYNSYTTY